MGGIDSQHVAACGHVAASTLGGIGRARLAMGWRQGQGGYCSGIIVISKEIRNTFKHAFFEVTCSVLELS